MNKILLKHEAFGLGIGVLVLAVVSFAPSAMGAGKPVIPVISNVSVSNVTPWAADINWTSDANSSDVVCLTAYYNYAKKGRNITYAWSCIGPTSIRGTTKTAHYVNLSPEALYTYYITATNPSNGKSSKTELLNFTTLNDPKTNIPVPPTNLRGVGVSSSQIDLIWDPAWDYYGAYGVVGYVIFRDGLQIDTTYTTSYSDTGNSMYQPINMTAGSAHTYAVSTINTASNPFFGPQSEPVTVSTLPLSPPPPPPPPPTGTSSTSTLQ